MKDLGEVKAKANFFFGIPTSSADWYLIKRGGGVGGGEISILFVKFM